MNRLVSIIVFIGLAVVLAGCGAKEKEEKTVAAGDRIEKVKIESLQKSKISRKIELSTTLEGYETMNISPSLTGKIEHIFVEVGSSVKTGDMLVRMDQNQLNTTKLAFANLGVELNRIKTLRETNTVSQQTLDQLQLSYDQTKQSLGFLEQNTFVKATMSGVVSAKNFEDGELYGGSPILVVTQLSTLTALINIPESYFPLVKKGMSLNIYSDIYPDQTFPATIEIVYPTIDSKTHSFQAKLKLVNGSNLLRPGMFVRTSLELGEVEAIMVPYQSVLKLVGSNERYVFFNENGIAKRKSVSLGQRFDEKVEILSNEIKEGDQLVTVGQAKLIDGIKLSIVE
jgi:membrane fusion protein, multidrug efflux system